MQKVQPGVVINFEKTGADPPPLNGEIKQNDEKDTNGAKGRCVVSTLRRRGQIPRLSTARSSRMMRKILMVQKVGHRGKECS